MVCGHCRGNGRHRVKAARVLILGAGVAGLQAIATAKRLVFGSVYSLIMIHRAYFGPSKSDAVLASMDAR